MPMIPQQAMQRTQSLYEEIAGRRTFVSRAEDYYRGKQPLRFASDKWREYNSSRYRDFADNWCAPVANATNERLRVTGFKLDDAPQQSSDERSLWDDWRRADLEAQSSQGFLFGIVASRSYAMIWGDGDGEPVATWERPDQFTIGHDPARPGYAIDQLKTWHDGNTEYATYITADEVWKWERPWLGGRPDGEVRSPRAAGFFETPAGIIVPPNNYDAWRPRQGSDDQWPMPNPLGILPAVELPNRPMLGAEPLSDIAGAMCMQDAINLLWAYLFNLADFASMPARVVMGQDPPKIPILDENGQKIGEREVSLKRLAEDRLLWLTGKDTKVSQWDAAKLDVFTDTIDVAVAHLAAQTRTPAHYFALGSGIVNVNADGLKVAETGLASKVGESHLFLSRPVAGIFERMALVRGNTGLAARCRTGRTQWKNAEIRSQAQLVDALQKLSALGFPFAWIAVEYGLGPSELEAVLKMKQEERAADPLAQLVQNSAGSAPPDPSQLPPARQ